MRTHDLYKLGQSPWLDMIERKMLQSGELKKMIEQEGLRGLTSNPTIFEKAICKGKEYEEAILALAARGKSTDDICEELTVADIRDAAAAFHPIYVESKGEDGYVSLEPTARYAYDLDKTIAEATRLFKKVGAPNLMIKVPGTPQGVAALTQLIASEINTNVTLIFSPSNYRQVAQAYIEGLEKLARKGADLSKTVALASVFVSRIDTTVDKRLQELIQQEKDPGRKREMESLLGKAAVANSKVIYQMYRERFGAADFKALEKKGAHRQRVLWGSTSTKNPAYSDVKYVNEIIGKDTINTMPPETWKAFLDHGTVKDTAGQGLDEAREVLAKLAKIGINMEDVCATLQKDGVTAFANSLDSLLRAVEEKKKAVLGVK